MRPASERGRPLIIAHRGLTSAAPENTVAAFRAAVEAGADGVELDVRLSRDGEVVVLHDHGLERTTSGTGPASRRSLAELKRLEVRGLAGERIPTLGEVFDALPDSFLTIVELKVYGAGFWGLASRALRVVREAGRLETAMVASFSPFSLLAVRLIEPRRAPRAHLEWESSRAGAGAVAESAGRAALAEPQRDRLLGRAAAPGPRPRAAGAGVGRERRGRPGRSRRDGARRRGHRPRGGAGAPDRAALAPHEAFEVVDELAHRLGVGAGGGLVEVAAQVFDGLGVASKAGLHHAAVAPLLGKVGAEADEHRGGEERPLVVLAPQVGDLQVAEHAGEHVPLADGGEVLIAPSLVGVGEVAEALDAFLAGEQQPAVEGVDEEARFLGVAHEEVAGQSDALHGHAGAPPHLHVDQGERDRDADAPLQHLVDVAVTGVVVVALVAGEAEVVEEEVAEGVGGAEGGIAVDGARRGPRQRVEEPNLASEVEIGVFGGGEEQRRLAEIDLGVGARPRSIQPVKNFRAVHVRLHDAWLQATRRWSAGATERGAG